MVKCEYKKCNNPAKYKIWWDSCDDKGEPVDIADSIDSCLTHITKLVKQSQFGIPIDRISSIDDPLTEYTKLKDYVNKLK